MHAAEGILTTRGGMTSHAAVVARGMGKPCVSGCGTIRVDYGRGTMSIGSRTFKTGDVITIDGSLGQVLAGRMPMIEPKLSGEFGTLMGWADSVRKLGVRVNGDTPDDARTAIKFGAEGIGLCRTEHMFFEETRIRTVREMILAEDEQSRRAALSKLLPMQRADFVELFEIMKGLPVTIRLLDPPLHEFLPHTQAEIEEVARAMNTDPRRLADRARDLAEFNPMLGFRGCRLAIAYPEIAEMQARAIFEAAVEAEKRTGKAVGLEVMVPLIATKAEFDLVKARIDATAQSVMKETGKKLGYQVGTMIELPRACLMAGDIAADRRVLLVRHQRPDADHLRHQPRRRRGLPRHLHRQGHSRDRSVHLGRSRRRRRTGQDRRRARPQDPAESQGRHLRRARRRSGFGGVLPRDRARLRLVLALPRADRAPRRGAGRARQDGREPGVVFRALMISRRRHARDLSRAFSFRRSCETCIAGKRIAVIASEAKQSSLACLAKQDWIASSLRSQ